MAIHPLGRATVRAYPDLHLSADIALARGRLHEACGSARRTLALWAVSRTQGAVFWIAPEWAVEGLNADGMTAFADPARFTFITPRRPEDVLWTMEEVLRAGVVPLVIADVPGLPGLTPVRRLHLAAETGAAAGQGGGAPLGLLLTPGDGGARGVETRWRMSPRHTGRRDAWHLDRIRARNAPEKSWTIMPGQGGLRPQDDIPAGATA